MAERRMFAKTIIDSDAFLDMPASAQSLYFHLAMRADDDGFINNPKRIQRTVGSSEDDLRLLIAKRFIIPFESGIVVIRHWRIHNYIQSDRYKETLYETEKARLTVEKNRTYELVDGMDTGCIQDGYTSDTQVRIGKVSKGKDSKGGARFAPPTHDEVVAYCASKHLTIDADRFLDYYSSNGWMVGRTHMKDWKAAARNWARRDAQEKQPRKTSFHNFEERESAGGDWSELETFQPDDDEPDDDESWEDLISGFQTGKRKEDK